MNKHALLLFVKKSAMQTKSCKKREKELAFVSIQAKDSRNEVVVVVLRVGETQTCGV